MSYQVIKEFSDINVLFLLLDPTERQLVLGICLSGRALVWQAEILNLIPCTANKQKYKPEEGPV